MRLLEWEDIMQIYLPTSFKAVTFLFFLKKITPTWYQWSCYIWTSLTKSWAEISFSLFTDKVLLSLSLFFIFYYFFLKKKFRESKPFLENWTLERERVALQVQCHPDQPVPKHERNLAEQSVHSCHSPGHQSLRWPHHGWW